MKNYPIRTNQDWCKPSKGAKYADTSLRRFRGWLKNGLRHVRLPNGRILTSYAWIDEYLLRFEVKSGRAAEIADELTQDL